MCLANVVLAHIELIIYKEHDACDHPGQRIAEHDCRKAVTDGNHDDYPHYTQNTDTGKRDDHRPDRISHSTEYAGEHLDSDICDVAGHKVRQHLGADPDHIRISRKQREDRRSEMKQKS